MQPGKKPWSWSKVMMMTNRFMYTGAKKCLRQTTGWKAVLDGAWADVDVTFTCAGGNPSIILVISLLLINLMTETLMMTLFGSSTNTRDNIGAHHQVRRIVIVLI